jgi:hypothetical protein
VFSQLPEDVRRPDTDVDLGAAVHRITVTVRRIAGGAVWPERARGTMMAP